MILVHELGHFWAARSFDVKVDVFSFGFGPRLFGFQRGETDYRFSLLPVRRLCQDGGRPARRGGADDPRGFMAKPRWQRLIIAFAGPFMNIVLAVAVLTGPYMVSYEKVLDDQSAVIGHVMPDSPAAKAGILPGDKIVRLNGKENPDWEDVVTTEWGNVGRPMSVSIARGDHLMNLNVTPVLDEKERPGRYGMGGPKRNPDRLCQRRYACRHRGSAGGRPDHSRERNSRPFAIHASRGHSEKRRQARHSRLHARRTSAYRHHDDPSIRTLTGQPDG